MKRKIPTYNEILDDMKKVYEEQCQLTCDVYEKHGKYSRNTYIKLDTFTNFKKHILPNEIRNYNISKEDLVENILYVVNKTNNTTKDNYLKHGKYSRKAIERIFGSWNKMLIELNLKINCLINIPEEDLLNDLINLSNKYGYVSSTIVKKHGTYSLEVYCRRFGTFNNALKKANLEIKNQNSPIAMYMIKLMSDILKEEPEYEKTFPWLINKKTNTNLYIDAYFPKNNIAFEYDGPQHRLPFDFYGGESYLANRKYLDNLKNNLLKENNILLIRLADNEPHDIEYLKHKLNKIRSARTNAVY